MSGPARAGSAMVYAALVLLAGLFVTPLVWLISTSLKPIEQAMAIPPTLVPRAYYAVIDGERLDVTRDYAVVRAGALVRNASGRTQPIYVDERGVLPPMPSGTTLLQNFESGWWHVSERQELHERRRPPRTAVVPLENLETEVRPRWSNYPAALGSMGGAPAAEGTAAAAAHVGFVRFVGNTVLVCVLGVVGTVFSNALVAYGFARLRWRGRDTFFAATLATMMVPFPVLMVPLYGVFKSLGLIGSLVPLWLPAFFGSAFNIFLMRQFFRSIPEELSEAARIDGCSELRIFWQVVLPLSKPVLTTAAVMHFIHAWNDFLGPLLYLTRKEDYTLAIALQNYQSQQGGVQWHHLMAASAVTILPIVVLFFLAQKTFVQGIATTGSKN